MVKKSDISHKEREIFRQAMVNIKPIQTREYPSYNSFKGLEKNIKQPIDTEQLPAPISESPRKYVYDNIGYFYITGLQNKVLHNLYNGRFKTDMSIDLHGYRLHEAEAAMRNCLQKAKLYQYRLVKVIQGKGTKNGQRYGRIKSWLLKWLPEQPNVLAWVPATSRDGGEGAGYLLLKRAR